MKKPRLHLACAQEVRCPPLALVKKALRMFAGKGISRETRHRNARAWIAAMAMLGDKHILRGNKQEQRSEVRWGRPGIDGNGVAQVFAPRRMGA